MDQEELYEGNYVRGLFDEMSRTYGFTNYLTSFGFTKRWRRACVGLVEIVPDMKVCDLMTGQGESWLDIGRELEGTGRIVGLDFSEEMCRRAERQRQFLPGIETEVVREDMLENSLPDASMDCVISTFGLKTFSEEQQRQVMAEVFRILKPGGWFSLLEISVPPHAGLRKFYLFYLRYCIPVAGRLFLGNPDNYRLLSRYTEAFVNCRKAKRISCEAGLETDYAEFFFGCASAIYGRKPEGAFR